ncbi:glycosyltransferase family 1 protein [bacterium]|nr:MAG: glycosyltransferase family 1 protein [bacterium]
MMDKRVNAGSIQAVANYVRAGDVLGHTIALYGQQDPNFPHVRFSTNISAFDYVMFIIESGLRWMSGLQLARILSGMPRRRRAILDTDGMYNQMIVAEGYDRNHATERDRSAWLAQHADLADRILQPTAEPREPGISPLPFFGYDPASQIGAGASPCKRFDIIHVGHNWWRWHEMSNSLLPAIERIRARLDGICFVGSWWDASPRWASLLSLEAAFRVDSDRLQRLCIQVKPPVPYAEVIPTMGQGRVNIMTQRPLLRHLRLLTSKYFEIFCADTIPLVMLNPDHAESVYGPAGRELTLTDRIEDKLLDALNQPDKYGEIVQEVRRHLVTHHSYQNRMEELVAALEA